MKISAITIFTVYQINLIMIQILNIPIFQDNYIWLIVNENTKRVIAVDPGDAKPLINYLKNNHMELDAIFITHHHWDHTGGISELLTKFPVQVFGPKNEVIQNLSDPLSEPDEINISLFSEPIKILNIPGHTKHHIAYYFSNKLFCGDTLFSAGCGRIFEGTPEEMYLSLQKIASLPEDTLIYCTHEYTLNNLRFAKLVEPDNQEITNKMVSVEKQLNQSEPSLPSKLQDEKKYNPFLRCHNATIIKSVGKYCGKKLNDPIEVFKYLREWKNNF